jgi:hypothetical protein
VFKYTPYFKKGNEMSVSGNYIVESDVTNWPDAVSSTETFATSAVNIADDKITVANDIDTASLIRFSSTDTLPSPLVEDTAYYAINVDSTHIKVATTPVNAAAGTAIDIADVGVGTHTLDVGEGSGESDRQDVIDRAEQLIEKITKDYFYAKDFVIYLSGNGKDRLDLGLAPTVLTVTEIKISGVVLTTSWWTYDGQSVYLNPESAIGSAGDPELLLRLKYEQNLFPVGVNNIKITGTYGWATCPKAIKLAAIKLCQAENDPTLYPTYDPSLSSERIGDYSYSLSSEVRAVSSGIPAVDLIIRPYIKKKMSLGSI